MKLSNIYIDSHTHFQTLNLMLSLAGNMSVI